MKVWAGIVLVSLCSLFVYVLTQQKPALTYEHILPSENVMAFLTYWATYLDTHDAELLLKEIDLRFKDDLPYDQHFAAHIAGELIYEKDGISAIASCTELFGFGCYHGLISSAVSEGGIVAVKQLDQMCIEMLGGSLKTETCQHGVGHGIMEYTGYTDVGTALALCAQTNDVLPELGCKSGVFMEYFNPMSESEVSAASLTPIFNPNDPLDVCDDVPRGAMGTCMFEAHSWWQHAGGLSAAQVGALCERSLAHENGEAIRSFCYLGHGNYIAPQFDFDIPKSVAHCDLMGTASGRAHCRAGVFWRLHFEKSIPIAREACDGLSPELFNECLETGSFACELEGTCEAIMEMKTVIHTPDQT